VDCGGPAVPAPPSTPATPSGTPKAPKTVRAKRFRVDTPLTQAVRRRRSSLTSHPTCLCDQLWHTLRNAIARLCACGFSDYSISTRGSCGLPCHMSCCTGSHSAQDFDNKKLQLQSEMAKLLNVSADRCQVRTEERACAAVSANCTVRAVRLLLGPEPGLPPHAPTEPSTCDRRACLCVGTEPQ
jgi:hypothetical protein